MNIPTAIRDEVYVKVRQKRETQVIYKSLTLDIDPDFKPWENSVTSGEVVSVPLKKHSHHYFHANVEHTVKVGDKIYFHYNTLLQEFNEVDIPGTGYKETYYRVPYDLIFARIVKGEPEVIGDRCLVESMIDTDGDIMKLEDGTMARVSNGIIWKTGIKHSTLRGVLRYIGKPLKGQPQLNCKPGDVVIFQKDADMLAKIEGKEYFCMIQEDIISTEVLTKIIAA